MYLKCVAKYKLSQLRINDGFFFSKMVSKALKANERDFEIDLEVVLGTN